VVPVAVTGTEDELVAAQLRRLRRPRLVVRIGEPFLLPPLNNREREKQLQEHTDEIMCRIAALLPSDYRGVYAVHPRLLSILQESAQTT
jgi:1-acyl-sn-glycerol-3-phosphate acyltransferase